MSNFILSMLFSLLSWLTFSSVYCLPIINALSPPNGLPPNPTFSSLRPSWLPAKLPTPPASSYSSYYWPSPSTYHYIRSNSSHGKHIHIPHVRGGPWDKAWEVYNDTVEKLKLFKRAEPLTPAERIATHLRSTGWKQKLKDFFRRITGRRLKVTTAQVDEVKRKYRGASHGSYRPQQGRRQGRVESAYPSSFSTGAPSAYRRKASRFTATY